MKPGDLVRFRAPHWLGGAGKSLDQRQWLVGVIIEHHEEESMVTLYHGAVIRIPAKNVQRYGKRYGKGYR